MISTPLADMQNAAHGYLTPQYPQGMSEKQLNSKQTQLDSVCVCVENCHLGAFVFPRASLFSAFLRTLALSARALLFVIAIFWLAVHFHVLLRVGPACAGSAPRSPRCSLLPCEPRAAGGCMSAELGGAYFLSSLHCMLVVPRANHSFQHVFRFFRRRLESVCVCVCVCVFCE